MSSFEEITKLIKTHENKIIEIRSMINELEKDIKQEETIIQNLNIKQRKLCDHPAFSEVFRQRVHPRKEQEMQICLTCGHKIYLDEIYEDSQEIPLKRSQDFISIRGRRTDQLIRTGRTDSSRMIRRSEPSTMIKRSEPSSMTRRAEPSSMIRRTD
jgi:hypothetical protein